MGGGGGEGRRWERVTTMFHSYSPQRPLPLRLFVSLMVGWRGWSLCSFFAHRTQEARNPLFPPLHRSSSLFLFWIFFFLIFFRRGEPLACFSRGIGFPLFWCFVRGRLIKAQAAARVWATGQFWKAASPPPLKAWTGSSSCNSIG